MKQHIICDSLRITIDGDNSLIEYLDNNEWMRIPVPSSVASRIVRELEAAENIQRQQAAITGPVWFPPMAPPPIEPNYFWGTSSTTSQIF